MLNFVNVDLNKLQQDLLTSFTNNGQVEEINIKKVDEYENDILNEKNDQYNVEYNKEDTVQKDKVNEEFTINQTLDESTQENEKQVNQENEKQVNQENETEPIKEKKKRGRKPSKNLSNNKSNIQINVN
jgi:hypothetical protein